MIRLLLTALSGIVFTMCAGGPVPEGCCEPGDRLDVVMQPAPGWISTCEDWGGEPVLLTNGLYVCEGVDF
jgi:hypothetical protein